MGKKNNSAKEIMHRVYKKVNNNLRLDMQEYNLCKSMHIIIPDNCLPIGIEPIEKHVGDVLVTKNKHIDSDYKRKFD
jgi:hypothetical protein